MDIWYVWSYDEVSLKKKAGLGWLNSLLFKSYNYVRFMNLIAFSSWRLVPISHFMGSFNLQSYIHVATTPYWRRTPDVSWIYFWREINGNLVKNESWPHFIKSEHKYLLLMLVCCTHFHWSSVDRRKVITFLLKIHFKIFVWNMCTMKDG